MRSCGQVGVLRETNRDRPARDDRGDQRVQRGRYQANDGAAATIRPELRPRQAGDRLGRGRRTDRCQAVLARPVTAPVRVRQGRRWHLQGHGRPRPRHVPLPHGLRTYRDPRVGLLPHRQGHQDPSRTRGLRHRQHHRPLFRWPRGHHRRLPPGALRLRSARRGPRHQGHDPDRQYVPQHRPHLRQGVHWQRRPPLRLLHVPLQRGLQTGDHRLCRRPRQRQALALHGRGWSHRPHHGHRRWQVGRGGQMG
mmetsp:Transcript_7867/g.24130  ORF Transcript_7867/g.24130 Transcript_7867/m.24130 type:complete len:251 (+) Transcript_7867:514-1266(+)